MYAVMSRHDAEKRWMPYLPPDAALLASLCCLQFSHMSVMTVPGASVTWCMYISLDDLWGNVTHLFGLCTV